MGNAHPLNSDETLRVPQAAGKDTRSANGWLRSAVSTLPAPSRLMPVAYSFADQALAVGGTFLANVMLARTQTKEEYGLFALSYSVFTFLSGLHSAAILEPYTVYGSGRYGGRFSEYLRMMARSNAVVGIALSGCLLSAYLILFWLAPQLASRALLGLGLTIGVLVSGIFLRRVFYLQRQAAFAAKTSLVFFMIVACGLWLTARAHVLNGLSVFLILALGWIVAGASFGRKLQFGSPAQRFLEMEPHYWREHWKYARWLLATALVFQLTTQGYYWLLAGLLSVKDVGELKAMYNLVAPIEQVLISFAFLALPAMANRYAAKRMGDLFTVWKHYAAAALGVTSLFALAVRVLGKPVMHALYAGKFDGLAPLLSILALTPLVMGVGNTLQDALKAMEKPKLVFYGFLGSGAATLFLGIPLVIHFGLRGAVYGMILSGAVYTGTLALCFWFCVRGKI